ncbi:uncharacterized protein LOC127718255 [Mytilus californianus]|uniref:uncharacterized protein LOC127718255 n=1 Tax=Mytilus californianus TaxID=6549 RepID=UPI002247F5C1|nr:uncharacterized protein LOC127718255 [Mytilus californianus]
MDLQQIPFETDCTSNTITIEWQGQRGQFNNYIVKYRDKDSKDVFAVVRISESKIQISNLRNETLYEIKIFVEDPNGDESLSFKTEVRTTASIASKLLKTASKICDDPVIYRLCPIKITNLPEGIQICEFFSDVNNKDERTLLLLGASGSGKSTLVDAIINYVTDVSFADNFRFKITDEISQGEEDIVCYKIRSQNGYKVGFNLNIIDVPGFESRYDESIYQKLLALFQSVRYISAACLVVPSFCRLTEEHRRIFSNILSIFGNDIDYVIPLITFDDGGEMMALNSLKEANVPCMGHNCFRFNNSQLLKGIENKEFWIRRQHTLFNLFDKSTVFNQINQCQMEITTQVLKSRIKLNQSLDEAKLQIQHIERRQHLLREYDLKNSQQQHKVDRNVEAGNICINCYECKKTCVFNCSLVVRLFWYFVVFFEEIWSFVCCICSCFRCCSRVCRCPCKRSNCCYIKCLQRCLGCTCSCSLYHHYKEYGRYSKNNRNTLQNDHDIEYQTECEIPNNDEKLQMEEEKQILMNELILIDDSISRHWKCIKTTALLVEIPEEFEIMKKIQEKLENLLKT